MKMCNSINTVRWPINTYAYVVIDQFQITNDIKWKYIRSEEIPLQLLITEKELIIYAGGSHVLERIEFPCQKKSVKAVVIEDGITVDVIPNDKFFLSRKFRIEFCDFNNRTGARQCKAFGCFLSQYITVDIFQTIPLEMESSQTESLQTSNQGSAENGASLESAALEAAIEKCLIDPKFPSLVNEVELYLDELIKFNAHRK